MRHVAAAGLLAVALAGCVAPSPTNALNTVVADGQLFCGVASAAGPLVVGIVDAANNKAVTVTGQASKWVSNVCALVNGIPVTPPAVPAATPVVAVTVPPVA